MTTPFKENYAFGLFISTSNGRKQIDHGGGIEGFNTELAYWPEDRLTVVVPFNLNGNASEAIANQLAGTLHGEKIELASERKEIPHSRDVLQAYVGAHQISPREYMQLTLEGDHVETQLPGREKPPIFAETRRLFFLKKVVAQLEFAKDSAGKATSVTLDQKRRDLIWKK